MKKVIVIICVILMLFSLPSCATETKFTVLEIGGYDHRSGADHRAEFTQKLERSIDDKQDQKRDFQINEEQYSLDYDYTQKGYWYNSEVDVYRKQDADRRMVEIRVNRESGAIDGYRWYDPNYVETVDTDEISRDECISIAKDYLRSYVEDIEQYELVRDQYWKSPEFNACYDFGFVRVIDGVSTLDKASIWVTAYGKVVLHSFTCLGEMKDAKLPSQDDMKLIRAAVDEKIKETYQSVEQKYDIEYTVDDFEDVVFMRLEDGSYAIQYDITVRLTPKDSEEPGFSELTCLLVIIE